MRPRLLAVLAFAAVLKPAILPASNASLRTEVLTAIARLEVEGNYSWQTTLPSGGITIDGQSESAGYTVMQMNPPGTSGSVVIHGERRVTETSYGWLGPKRPRKLSLPDLMQSLRPPVQELPDIVERCGGLTISGNVVTGSFGTTLAEELWQAIAGRMPSPAPHGRRVYIVPEVAYGPPTGRIEIAVTRGVVTGYKVHLERTMSAGCFGRPTPVQWVISTSIHSVGTTNVRVPAGSSEALADS